MNSRRRNCRSLGSGKEVVPDQTNTLEAVAGRLSLTNETRACARPDGGSWFRRHRAAAELARGRKCGRIYASIQSADEKSARDGNQYADVLLNHRGEGRVDVSTASQHCVSPPRDPALEAFR